MAKVKTCKNCGAVFTRYNSKRTRLCHPCFRKKDRAVTHAKPPSWRAHNVAKSVARISAMRERFGVWKATKGCSQCPENTSSCLDMHHPDPTKKEFSVSRMCGSGWSWDKIIIEAEKCIVICSNCHRKLHAKLREEKTTPL